MRRGSGVPLRAACGVAFIAVCVCALASCGSAEPPTPATALKPTNPCKDTSALKAHIEEFLRAFNAGDRAGLNATIASRESFRVYSERLTYKRHGGRFFATKQRKKLIRHLLHRHAKGDRMWLPGKLQVGDYDRSFQLCGIGSNELSRRIAGGPRKRFYFKGALDAPSGRVAVWNIGGPVGRNAVDSHEAE